MPGVRAMAVLDVRGVVVAASQPSMMGVPLGGRPYFRKALARPDRDALIMSEPFTTALSVYSIVLAKSWFAADGRFGGVVAATLDPQHFGVLLRSVVYAPEVQSAMFDARGTVFLRMPRQDHPVPPTTAQELAALARHRASGAAESLVILPVDADGVPHLLIVRSTQPAALHLDDALVTMIRRPLPEVLANWRRHAIAYGALLAIAWGAVLTLQRKERDLENLRQAREQAAKEQAQRVQLALDGGDLGLWEVDIPAGLRTVDARALAMVGLPSAPGAQPMHEWAERIHPDDQEGWRAAQAAYLAGQGEAFIYDYRVRHALGHWIWIHSRGKVAVRDEAGQPVRMTGTYLDITARKEAEARVARSEQLLARMSRVSRTGGWDHDLRTGRSIWSDEMFRIRELDPPNVPTQEQIMQSFSEESRARLLAARQAAIAHQTPWDMELQMTTAKGQRIWVRSQGEAVVENGVTVGLTGTLKNVTWRKQSQIDLAAANVKLAEQAMSDGLTGIANRRLFDQTLAVEWTRSARSQAPLALLLIDIDHFKRYNDHYGHALGDDCLRRVAQLLAGCSRRAGDLVSRYGGEEFAVLLPGIDLSSATRVAQICVDAVRDAGIVHAASPSGGVVTVSVGVASLMARADQAPLVLVEAADAALYDAKRSGRGRFAVARQAGA